MPSPIGHALGGAIISFLFAPKQNPQNSPDQPHPPDLPYETYLTACVVAACAPDVDFLWGRHNRETHSVVIAVFVAIAVWLVTRRARLALACSLAWASHVLFDWLGSDDSPPLGVMALWPFTQNFYFADAYVFEAISRRYAEPGFWRQNIWAVAKELVMLLPPAAVLWWRHRRRGWRHGRHGEKESGGETRKP